MTYTRPGAQMLILGALLSCCVGCTQSRPGWQPPLEKTSTRILQNKVEEALQLVRGAQGGVRTDPQQVEEWLEGAVRTLGQISKYYLPLLEARDRTCDAHRLLYSGERQRARAEIQAVEDILDEVAKAGGPRLLPAIREPLDLVSEAKAALMAASDEAPELIEALAVKLNFLTLKGELELPDGWPAPESTNG